MTQKRSVINWTDEQYERLAKAADRLGQTVPQYCKTAALEKERQVNAKD
jgi:predicted DNA-binding protein